MSKHKSDVKEQALEVTVPASGSVNEAKKVIEHQEKERVKTETHSCGQCKWYDHATEREFHRDGIRQGLVETRAICRAPKEKTKSSSHLVKKESNKPCFEAGVYISPGEEKKTKEQKTAEAKKQRASDKDKATRTVATNGLTGKGHDKKVLAKNIA